MDRYGKAWRVATYIPDTVANKLKEERERTKESESKCIARILEAFLFPDPVKQEGE